ncbi:MAG TPA: DJ-1/PfpI family protein [Rubrobacter sp.]|nr:DJ-1/PfpI family protein [Rubrobacter sp.]
MPSTLARKRSDGRSGTEPDRSREEPSGPSREDKKRSVAIVTYPGVALLDLVAIKKVLDRLAKASKYRTVSVGERTEPMASDTPLGIIPEKRFEEVPAPFALVVPGGGMDTLKAMGEERLLDYLRFASYGAEVVLSVSTGAFLLAAAGILEGRQATTHWAYYKVLEQFGITYVRKRWVEDGKFICSAGVSAGIDMALAARLTDEGIARRVQRSLGYDPHPSFGGIDYDHLDAVSAAARAGLSLAAPLITAGPSDSRDRTDEPVLTSPRTEVA